MKSFIITLTVITLCVLCCGCKRVGLSLPPDAQVIERMSQIRYPADAPLGDDLDMIVTRDGAAIELVNRTPHTYDHHFVWLNRQYVSQIDRIKIGRGNEYRLSRFINHHRESFPVGALLAPDKARPLASAELVDPQTGRRHRLVVRTSDN